MEERMKILLRKAAIEFERCSNPFSTEWLSENKVLASECRDLSSWIGTSITVMIGVIGKGERKKREYNPSKRS